MPRRVPLLILMCLSCLVMLNAVDAAQKVRVFVTDSQSWEMSSGAIGVDDGLVGTGSGGARPQTAEIIKTFGERCPEVTVTLKRDRADFIILLDHEGGKSFFRKDNKVVVFDKEGDALFSGSTASLGNAVKDACNSIRASLSNTP